MKLYHFLKMEFGLLALKNQRLKLAIINELNDPFEHIGVDLTNKEIRGQFKFLRNHLSSKYGILCFSNTWKNPLLWSHYADKHTGLCLGFDVYNIKNELLVPVNYVPQRLPMNETIRRELVANQSVPDTMKILSAKSNKWAYEEETRLYASLKEKDSDGRYYQYFDKVVKLREVFIGANAKISQITLLEHMKNCRDIKITKTRIGFKEFDIVPQKDKRLWYVPEDSADVVE